MRQQDLDTKSWHNSLKRKIFRYPKLVTQSRVPPRKLWALWDKTIDRKSWYFLHPLLSIKFFDTRKFLKCKPEGCLYEIFWHCETKKIDRKSWYAHPPTPQTILNIFFFRHQKFWEKQVPLQSFSVLWDNKFSIESRGFPLSGIEIFDTRNFLKIRRVPRRNFLALLDSKTSTQNRDTTPWSVKSFDTRN